MSHFSKPLTQQDRKEIKHWTTALRSGEYKQGRCKLQTSEGYCCLGVACVLFTPKDKLEMDGGMISGGLAKNQPHGKRWLNEIDDVVGEVLGERVVILNDYRRYTFTEIADVIDFIIDNDLHEV